VSFLPNVGPGLDAATGLSREQRMALLNENGSTTFTVLFYNPLTTMTVALTIFAIAFGAISAYLAWCRGKVKSSLAAFAHKACMYALVVALSAQVLPILMLQLEGIPFIVGIMQIMTIMLGVFLLRTNWEHPILKSTRA
jgi:uncharacterized protein YacL